MKINGVEIKGKNLVTVFIPRDSGGIELICQPVDFDKFEQMCPAPTPPIITKPGQLPKPDVTDKKYQAAIHENGNKRVSYMVVYSLLATPGFSWDSVNLDDPDTWGNYQNEFKDCDFTQIEVNRIISAVFKANCLDEDHIKAAHEHFLALKRLEEAIALSQTGAQGNT